MLQPVASGFEITCSVAVNRSGSGVVRQHFFSIPVEMDDHVYRIGPIIATALLMSLCCQFQVSTISLVMWWESAI